MVPRPTTPTSLLWAHQLRLEHRQLLARIGETSVSIQGLTELCQVVQAQDLNAVVNDFRATIAELQKEITKLKVAKFVLPQKLEEATSAQVKTEERRRSQRAPPSLL